jgi:hypothetical protein
LAQRRRQFVGPIGLLRIRRLGEHQRNETLIAQAGVEPAWLIG